MGLFYRSENWEVTEAALRPGRTRNHILCIDGTFDQAEEDIRDESRRSTNVHRVFQLTEGDDEDQISRYHSGVGIEAGDDNRIRKGIAGIGGKGARRIRREVYWQLLHDYRRGDRLYIFGYSRGAAIARTLANEIAEKGIPKKASAKWQRFTRGRRVLFELRTEGKATDVEIRQLNLWDTVPAFGLAGNKIEIGKNLDLAPNVDRVVHLLAADEDRKQFDPTLFEADAKVEEIWMPGVHSDVGGGAPDRALTDLALACMLDRTRSELRLDPAALEKHGDALGPVRDQSNWKLGNQVRSIRVEGSPTQLPTVHRSLEDRELARRAAGADSEIHRSESFEPLFERHQRGETAYQAVEHAGYRIAESPRFFHG